MELALVLDAVMAVFLTLPRLIGLAIFVPFLRADLLTGVARNAILLGPALVVFPIVFADIQEAQLSTTSFTALAAKEALLGAAMGFLIALGFFIPQAIGDFIDNQRGAGIASIFNPAAGTQASVLGTLFSQGFIAWFLIAGGMQLFFHILFQSYNLYPVTAAFPLPTARSLEVFLAFILQIMLLIALLAIPVVFAMLMTEVGLGLVGRFAQQLNVFFLAMPLKGVIGLLIVILYFGVLMDFLFDHGVFLDPFFILDPARHGEEINGGIPESFGQ